MFIYHIQIIIRALIYYDYVIYIHFNIYIYIYSIHYNNVTITLYYHYSIKMNINNIMLIDQSTYCDMHTMCAYTLHIYDVRFIINKIIIFCIISMIIIDIITMVLCTYIYKQTQTKFEKLFSK